MQWSFLLICVGSIWVKNRIASSYMLMVGVAASRFGLWMFDLAVIQQMQVGYNIFSRKTDLSRILPYVTLTQELISNTGLCSSVELALFVNNHYFFAVFRIRCQTRTAVSWAGFRIPSNQLWSYWVMSWV